MTSTNDTVEVKVNPAIRISKTISRRYAADETIYVKILNGKMNHHGFQYVEGLNIDTVPFDASGSCKPGGLYYTKLSFIGMYIEYGTLLAIVTIPDDAKIYEDRHGYKWKADKIILSDIMPIEEHPLWINNTLLHSISLQINGLTLQYIKNQTEKLCLIAIIQNPHALRYVVDQTEEICLVAVQQNGHLLECVKKQTSEICLAAVKQQGYALRWVKEQTSEICLAAVQRNAHLLEYVVDQTEEICTAAAKQNFRTLQYLRCNTIGANWMLLKLWWKYA